MLGRLLTRGQYSRVLMKELSAGTTIARLPLGRLEKEAISMRETRLTLPELGLIAGTRGALGAGLGLLLGDYLTHDERKAVGWTLFLVGAVSTVPLAFEVLGRRERDPQIEIG